MTEINIALSGRWRRRRRMTNFKGRSQYSQNVNLPQNIFSSTERKPKKVQENGGKEKENTRVIRRTTFGQ